MPVVRATFDLALILKPALLLRLPFLGHHHWANVGDQCGRAAARHSMCVIFILRWFFLIPMDHKMPEVVKKRPERTSARNFQLFLTFERVPNNDRRDSCLCAEHLLPRSPRESRGC